VSGSTASAGDTANHNPHVEINAVARIRVMSFLDGLMKNGARFPLRRNGGD
jgi:hypothetical protein